MKCAVKLNQLNFLLGKENLKEAVDLLYEENPKAFSVLEILIAVRKDDKKFVLNENSVPVLMESYFEDADSIFKFIESTGLAEIFRSEKRLEYLEKLEKQARLFRDNEVKVLGEPRANYGQELPF